jgi:hypothetical protein
MPVRGTCLQSGIAGLGAPSSTAFAAVPVGSTAICSATSTLAPAGMTRRRLGFSKPWLFYIFMFVSHNANCFINKKWQKQMRGSLGIPNTNKRLAYVLFSQFRVYDKR